MTAQMIAEIIGIMFLATVFRTTFGFGEALVAVPLLALIIPVKVAAPIAVLASIVIAGIVVYKDWQHIHFRSAAWLIFSTLFGLPLGLFLLKTIPESIMKGSLAIIILIFSSYSLLRSKRFSLRDDRFAWIFGLIAGICGGSYGMNGPPLAIYGSLRGWSPEKFRATLQGYFLPASLLGLCGYGLTGLWTTTVTHLFLFSIPSIAAGIFIGRFLNRKMGAHHFARILHFGLIFIALILLSQILG